MTLNSSQSTHDHQRQKAAARVDALLAKAARTDYPEEADAFLRKAQDIRDSYGLDANDNTGRAQKLPAGLSEDQEQALERIRTWFTAVRGATRACSLACPGVPRGTSSGRGGSAGDDDEDGDDVGKGDGNGALVHTHGASTDAPVFSLGGLAGTGKTTIIRLLEQFLDCDVTFCAPTHKAAGVLSAKLGGREVKTMHSVTVRTVIRYSCVWGKRSVKKLPLTCVCGKSRKECECPPRFTECGNHEGLHKEDSCKIQEELEFEPLSFLLGKTDLLVIDESSMVPGETDRMTDSEGKERVRTVGLDRILEFGVPVLVVGDPGQLPPVRAVMNRWTAHPDVLLTTNHRQACDTSGIVEVAQWAREGIQLRKGVWGDGRTVVLGFDDPRVKGLLTPQRYARTLESTGQAPVYICWKNSTRAYVNRMIHGVDGSAGVDGQEAEAEAFVPRVGEPVISMQRCTVPQVHARAVGGGGGGETCWVAGIGIDVPNNRVGHVVKVVKINRKTVDVVLKLDEPQGRHVQVRAARAQFTGEAKLAQNQKPANATLWSLAYALTCHRAQGSEYGSVVVLAHEMPRAQAAQWLYTAVTRAKDRLIVTVQ